jgi:glycosyltransferase involved in cell wall biosynthesis
MKIFHLVAGDLSGGAARGAYWLHQGLQELGVDSTIFTNSRETFGDNSVVSLNIGKKNRVINAIRSSSDGFIKKLYSNADNKILSTGFFGGNFINNKLYESCDVVHLHWINAGFVNIKDLSKINKPIVWTMRDMWPMTGGCHYAMGCRKFESGCGQCPQLGSGNSFDISKWVLARKKKFLPPSIKVIGISDWLSDEARKSSLFRDFDIRTIHNNVNTDTFRPIDKFIARGVLGITNHKKIILVGATNVKDFYKGFGKFFDSLKYLDKEKYQLCFFGKIDSLLFDKCGYDFTTFGFLHYSLSLRLAYSCADVFVAPSIEEAFGKTLVESMACGTPVVCFDATGPKDIVTHQIDGYKAKPYDVQDIAAGISWVSNHDNYDTLSKSARNSAVSRFGHKVIAQKYMNLYNEILVR